MWFRGSGWRGGSVGCVMVRSLPYGRFGGKRRNAAQPEGRPVDITTESTESRFCGLRHAKRKEAVSVESVGRRVCRKAVGGGGFPRMAAGSTTSTMPTTSTTRARKTEGARCGRVRNARRRTEGRRRRVRLAAEGRRRRRCRRIVERRTVERPGRRRGMMLQTGSGIRESLQCFLTFAGRFAMITANNTTNKEKFAV